MEPNDPDPARAYADALQALSRVLVDAPSLRSTLQQLLEVAAIAAPGITALTVTAVAEDGELTAAASTDDHAKGVDEYEYAIEEGPCIAALATGEEQLVRDASTDERWPKFAERAVEEGFSSIAGIPLRAPDRRVIGALDIFSHAVDGITDRDLAVLRRVASPAAVVLANARAYRRTTRLSEQLATTLEDRAVLNRAIGIVLGRQGGTAEAASRLLEATAEREGRSLLEVAQELVQSRPIGRSGAEDEASSGS